MTSLVEGIAPPGREVSSRPAAGETRALTAAKADYLLETLVCGAYETGVQVAAFAQLLTAYARAGDVSRVVCFRHIMSDDSEVMLLALSYGDELGLAVPVVAALQTVYRALAPAKRELNRIAKSSDREAAPSAAQEWRRIAGLAILALDLLQKAVRARLHETYQVDGRAIRRFLEQAVAADAGVFDRDGALQLPKLEQRRRLPRLAVRRACTLILSTGAYPARLADVSQQGLAVICKAVPNIGETVEVELDSRRRLSARVARVDGDKIGLRLDKALAFDDPLIFAVAG